ncbi:unnamed protein product [Cylicocyclus nassatus]|uniref:Aldehyde dehydrogenase domain-containing protein n=1 Tax=Cylicocyclus nassatus TaxID=53992 RepID=A0AA36DNY6_CYLNA|nr:unnamed protein product [Cylicocyclus nassatus]
MLLTIQAVLAVREAFERRSLETTTKECGATLTNWHDLLVAKKGNQFLDWFSGEAGRINRQVVVPAVLLEPIGVATFTTPWNFPTAMLARLEQPLPLVAQL